MKIDKDHSNLLQSLRKLIKQASRKEGLLQMVPTANEKYSVHSIVAIFRKLFRISKMTMQVQGLINQALRQLSFKLMSLLLSKNQENKQEFCKIFEIFPTKGKVVLNKIPAKLIGSFPDMPTLLSRLKQSNPTANKQVYLSSYNQIPMTLDHSSYTDDNFLDPQNAVIIMLVEEDKQSPKKATFFGNYEEVSTPKKKTRQVKEVENAQDVVNTSAGRSSPLDSVLAYSSRTRPRS